MRKFAIGVLGLGLLTSVRAHAQSGNTATGTGAMGGVTGTNNTADGVNACWALRGGSENTGIGRGALFKNVVGSGNSAVGQAALYNNTGLWNTALGDAALISNTSGSFSVAVGSGALASCVGASNTAVGTDVMGAATSSTFDVAIGREALYNATNDTGNVAVGWHAGSVINYGSYNTAVGRTAMGARNALTTVPNGNYNSAFGNGALGYNADGEYGSAFGDYALGNNVSGTLNTALGYAAAYQNSTGLSNLAVGNQALYFNTTGSWNTAVGPLAGPTAPDLFGTGAFGNGATPTASNTIRIGNSSITQIGGAVGWSNLSDGRFKTNVRENVVGLALIAKLRPVTFSWDMDKLDAFQGITGRALDNAALAAREAKETQMQTGFIAQEVEQAALQAGYDFSGVVKPANDRSPYQLSYAEFVVPLVKAVQEQQHQIEADHRTIEELRAAVAKLEPKATFGSLFGESPLAFAAALGVLVTVLKKRRVA